MPRFIVRRLNIRPVVVRSALIRLVCAVSLCVVVSACSQLPPELGGTKSAEPTHSASSMRSAPAPENPAPPSAAVTAPYTRPDVAQAPFFPTLPANKGKDGAAPKSDGLSNLPQPGPLPPVPSVPPYAGGADMASLPPSAATPPIVAPSIAGRPAVAALLVPLSGSQAALGGALFNAAQMALFEVGDESFTLLPFDTKGTAEGAVAAAQMAVSQHADVIIGPLFAAEVKAVAPITRQAGLSMVSFTTDRTTTGNGVYTLGFLPGPQAVQVIRYARTQGRARLAVLAPSSEYGRRVTEFLYNDPSVSAMIASVQYYDPAAPDVVGPVKRLIKSDPKKPGDVGFDVLFLPDEGPRLRSVAATLAAQGVTPPQVKLVGTMLWDDGKANAEPALVGGWYAVSPTASRVDFDGRYVRAFGVKPPRLASLGYDAMALAAVLARRGAHDFSQTVLTNSAGFAGVDGLFRLLPDGTADRVYAIDEVAPNGAPLEVAPAPTTFGPAN